MIPFLLQSAWERMEQFTGDERLSNILWFAGIVVATLVLKRPVSLLLARLATKITNRFGDKAHQELFKTLILKPVEWLLQTLLFYVAINQLSVFLNQVILTRRHEQKLSQIRIMDVADKLFLFFIILFVTLLLSRVVDFIFHVFIDRAYKEDEKEKQQLFPLLKEVGKILVWTIGVFWGLGSVFEVNIPALITGLGIGGVAIALAAKESVENFFASFTILTDKPFQTGDGIRLGALEGTVERIGFRSTRLRHADGSMFIIPNKKLINENLENLSQRHNRRIRASIPIKYGQPKEALAGLIEELKKAIEEVHPAITKTAVAVDTFNENALQLTVSCYLPEPMTEGWNTERARQEMYLKIYEILNRQAIAAEGSAPAKAAAAPQEEKGEEPGEEDL